MESPDSKQILDRLVHEYYNYFAEFNERPHFLLVSPEIFDIIPRTVFQGHFPEIRQIKPVEIAEPIAPILKGTDYFWFEQWMPNQGPHKLGPIHYLDLESLRETSQSYPTTAKDIAALLV